MGIGAGEGAQLVEQGVAAGEIVVRQIEKVYQRRPPKAITLDMDSSNSPTYSEQRYRAGVLGV
jgi:hypothetical protein